MNTRLRSGNCLLAAILALALGPFAGSAVSQVAPATGKPSTKEMKRLTIGIGFQSPGLMLDAARAHLRKTKLFEQIARDEFGYELDVNYRVFAFAPEHLTAMHAGEVQIGTMATYPILNQVSLGQPIRPLNISWGGLEYHIAVRKGGPITKFEDLPGKTVALPVGTALQGAFETFLLMEFGKTGAELGIKYINQGVPVPFLPQNVDATITWLPIWLNSLSAGRMEILAYLSRVPGGAMTGAAYDGPLGKGKGIAIPSVKKSPFHPEGYIALRHVFSTFGNLPEQHPDVVVAWLVAYQKTVQAIRALSPEQVMDLLPKETFDQVSRDTYKQEMFGREFLYDHRDWTWLTEGDLDIMAAEAQLMKRMGVLKRDVTKQELLNHMRFNLPLMRRAYELAGRQPSPGVFTKAHSPDRRGIPIWEVKAGVPSK